jgi:hypothetical protein
MMRITIAIVIGTSLVMGALMYGATKPLANQAFAATPCSLTVGNEGTTTISGKLECGGQGLGHATIHLTLHHITTGRTTTATAETEVPDGSYDHAVVLGACHSYTADAKYDGDNDHQPAFATASINIPGPIGSTQNCNNAGSGQGTSNAGNSSNAGSGQQNNNTQASAATACSLTVGTPSGENPPGSLIGKLTCGGQGIDGATIHSRGLPGGLDESAVTGSDGSYEIGISPPLSLGQIFYPYVDFYGDNIKHLQDASATTTIDLRGVTANTQDNTNTGTTQDNTNTGTTQDNTNTGTTQDNTNTQQ